MIDVTRTVTTRELRVGDRTGAGAVTKIELKDKWAMVWTDAKDTATRVLKDAEWSVTRSEKTEEEKATEIRNMSNQILAHNRAGAFAQLVKARARITEYMEKGYVVGYSETEDLIAAQETEAIWCGVDRVMENLDI